MLIDLTCEKIVPELEQFEINEMFDNEHFKNWFAINEDFIAKMIESYIREYGWAFGGAFEMYLNLKQFYMEHPYNLEDYDEVPSSLSVA